MKLGAVNAVNSIPNAYGMSAVRMKHTQRTQSADIVGKKLQNEITDKQQKKNDLTSNANMPAREKAGKSIELEQGISNLKAQLRRHEIETGDEQKKQIDEKPSVISEQIAKDAEAKAAKEEAKKEAIKEAAKEEAAKKAAIKEAEKKNAAKEERMAEQAESAEKSSKDIKAFAASDSAKNQIEEQNSVIAKTEAGIVIKKGEMRQDKMRGENTDKNKEEIDAQEKKSRLLMNITLGPKGVNNGSAGMKVSNSASAAGMKASNYGLSAQNQNIVHDSIDGKVLFKAG